MSSRNSTQLMKDTQETLVDSHARLSMEPITGNRRTKLCRQSAGCTLPQIPEDKHLSPDIKQFLASPTLTHATSPSSSPSTPESTITCISSSNLASSPKSQKSTKSWLFGKRLRKLDEDRFHSIRETALAAIRTALNIAEALDIPYLKGAAGIVLLILESIDDAALNKEECARIINKVSNLTDALMKITMQSKGTDRQEVEDQAIRLKETSDVVLATVRQLSARKRRYFSKLLQKERDKKIIQRCNTNLQDALELFSLESNIDMRTTLTSFEDKLKLLHQLIEEIPYQLGQLGASDALTYLTLHDEGHQGTRNVDAYQRLPVTHEHDCSEFHLVSLRSPPEIFLGRDEELRRLVDSVCNYANSRIAILGPGGIGKSSLSLMLLHHDSVTERYGARRFFVSCDSATSVEGLISAIASQVGLCEQLGANSKQCARRVTDILAFLRQISEETALNGASIRPTILVLDNFETVWEPDRANVEDFLRRLATVDNLTIVITLRGIEQPSDMKWNKFLLPVLDRAAGREMFLHISSAKCDSPSDSEASDDLDELLSLCGWLPLAIRLMAELIAIEGCDVRKVLARWKKAAGSITIPSTGADRDHSLEISIRLSLESPRMKKYPGAFTLLGLLSMIPDGIREDDLERATPNLKDREECRFALKSTALAYLDKISGRLKVLAPIRGYVSNSEKYVVRPPFIKPLEDYFWGLVVETGSNQGDVEDVKRALMELGNIESLIERAFWDERVSQASFDPSSAILGAINLSRFFLRASLGQPRLALLEKAHALAERMKNKKLQADCIYTKALANHRYITNSANCQNDFRKALTLYRRVKDKVGEGNCLNQLGAVYYSSRDFKKARDSAGKALRVHAKARCTIGQATAKLYLARISYTMNETESAIAYCRDALTLLQENNIDRLLEAQCLQLLGCIQHATLCNYTEARKLLEESLRIYEDLSLEESANCMDTMVSLGEVAVICSRYEEARDAFAKAAEIYHKKKRRDREAYARVNLGLAHLGLGSPTEATRHISNGFTIWEGIDNKWGIGCSHVAFGDVARHQNDHAQAESEYSEALRYFQGDSSHWKPYEAECRFKIGLLRMRTNQDDEARQYIQSAFRLYNEADRRRDKANCLRYLAELDLDRFDGRTRREALIRLEMAEREFSIMDLEVERQECALLIAKTNRSLGEVSPKAPALRTKP